MEIIALREAPLVARGRSRLIYRHPADQALLIKVLSPQFLERRRSSATRHHPLKRARMNSVFVREIREQLILVGKGEATDGFLQRIVGFCDTDLGLGMVVEAIHGADGRLAPTLAALIRGGQFDEYANAALDRFLQRLLASDIVLAQLAVKNLLFAADPEGRSRFVLIDGYGESKIIPWQAFRIFNKRAKLRHIAALRKQMAGLLRPHATEDDLKPADFVQAAGSR